MRADDDGGTTGLDQGAAGRSAAWAAAAERPQAPDDAVTIAHAAGYPSAYSCLLHETERAAAFLPFPPDCTMLHGPQRGPDHYRHTPRKGALDND